MTEIPINNGHRSDGLANMTTGEYKNHETLSNRDICVTVFKHKQAKAGPSHVIFRGTLFEWLKT